MAVKKILRHVPADDLLIRPERLGKSLALGMVPPNLGDLGTELEVTVLGKRYKATVIEESPFDPKNERLRA